MNGIGTLLAILLAAQVGLPAPYGAGTSGASTPPSALSDATRAEYGWYYDENNVLCYIVQISPGESAQMQAAGEEKHSDMPKELIGRVGRFCVRVGNAPLPREPSLEVISRLPLINQAEVTAQIDALGPGRIAEVDPPVVNVQRGGNGSQAPFSGAPFPGTSPQTAGGNARNSSQLTDNPVDRARQAMGNAVDQASQIASEQIDKLNLPGNLGNPADMFSAGARGQSATADGRAGSPSASLPNDPQSFSGFPAGAGNDRFRTSDAALQTAGGSRESLPPFNRTPDYNTAPSINDAAPTYTDPAAAPNTDRWTTPSPASGNARLADNRANNGSRFTGDSSRSRDMQPLGSNRQQAPVDGFGSNNFGGGNLADRAGLGGNGYGADARNARQFDAYGYPLTSDRDGGNVDASFDRFSGSLGAGNPGAGAAAVGRQPKTYSEQDVAEIMKLQRQSELLATTAGVGLPGTSSTGQKPFPSTNAAGSPSDGQNGQSENTAGGTSSQETASNSGNNPGSGSSPKSRQATSILQVFFVLSLVFNLYLGYLIRKLLTRYRTLLMNVRSQTA